LAEARVQRVTDHEARSDFGISGPLSKDMSGIVFPYISPVTGYRVTARLRRDNPEIKDGREKNKYISPWGDGKHLYFPPRSAAKLRHRDIPIVLVESEKASLALTAWAQRVELNLLALGLGGCWGWKGRIGTVENVRGERVEVTGPLRDLSYCNGRKVFVLLDANVATNRKVRSARDALVDELRKRECEVLLCELPILNGVNGPDDFIAVCGDDAVVEVFESAHEHVGQPTEYADDALALKFTDQHGSILRYTAAFGRWSVWDGTVWRPDSTCYVFDLARRVCRTESSSCQNGRIAPRIASAVTISAVERLARADRRHAATIEQWDAEPWLLNTPGGVVDLRNGELRPALREDYMTKITAIAPGGQCPLWFSFLARITNGNQDLQRFLQRMCGYALTGVTREHALFFLYGTGANGKSVFLNTISGLMADYARTAPIETFIDSKSDHHPTDLAGLQGARLITAVETEDGRHWAESKLKALTGGDRIAARFMRQDYFEFTPQFKLVIAGNHKPGLRTVDEAIRRRFILVPFTVTIPAPERDLELGEKLRGEWGGILQWMIEGCLEWQSEGLQVPKAVRDATKDYLASEDLLSRWIEDCCVRLSGKWESATALFRNWRLWCMENQEDPGSQKRFSENLESHGFEPKRTKKARGFNGIGLVTGVTG
jgi:putative DNA primase/helicase